jgi:regulator of protease activity HflC (stomatin/prohibitin superfamily)
VGISIGVGILIVIVIILFIGVLSSIKIVRTKEAFIIERFGQYSRTLEAGFHLILPFIEVIRARVSMQQIILEVPPQDVITHENVKITIDSIVFFEILDPHAAVYNIQNYRAAIAYSVPTNLRDIIGKMSLDETFNSRDKINSLLSLALDDVTATYGIKIHRVEIRDIIAPADVQEAMDRQMKAERNKRATILNAEAEKQSAITTAEGQKQSVIMKAEGDKESNIRRAEGVRESRILEAEGQAEAIKTVAIAQAEAIKFINNSILESGTNETIIAIRQLETLLEMSKNPANKMFIPTEIMSGLGSVGVIADMLKENKTPEVIKKPVVNQEVKISSVKESIEK